MSNFRKSNHPGREAYRRGNLTVQALFHAAERMLTREYGYDFSDENIFPNGFVDMIGHADAYADWVADMKGKVRCDADYELLAAIRYIVDFTER